MESPLEYAIGIDVGGTTTKFGIVNHRGEISNRGDILTNRHKHIDVKILLMNCMMNLYLL